jgi:hypothetical protein
MGAAKLIWQIGGGDAQFCLKVSLLKRGPRSARAHSTYKNASPVLSVLFAAIGEVEGRGPPVRWRWRWESILFCSETAKRFPLLFMYRRRILCTSYGAVLNCSEAKGCMGGVGGGGWVQVRNVTLWYLISSWLTKYWQYMYVQGSQKSITVFCNSIVCNRTWEETSLERPEICLIVYNR